MIGSRARLVLAAAAISGLALLDCAPAPRSRTFAIEECRGLDPELIRHFRHDDAQAWGAYCRDIGVRGMLDAWTSTMECLSGVPLEEFRHRRRPIEELCFRMGVVLRDSFQFSAPLDDQRFRATLADEQEFEHYRLIVRSAQLSASGAPAADRLRDLEEVRTRLLAMGSRWQAVRPNLEAARLELEIGRPDRHRARLNAGLAEAMHLGEHYLACQVLGELGSMHAAAGAEDSMRVCFDRALGIARAHRLLDQSARLLRFDASYYARRGRLALAADRLAEAQRLCAEPGAETVRLRMQIEHARFLASLECWDLVGRSLRRVPILFRDFPETGRTFEARKHAFDAACLEARLAFAEGDPLGGDRRMRACERAIPEGYRRIGYSELFDHWSQGLARCAWWSRALEITERGLTHCDTAHVPEGRIPLQLCRATVLQALGRVGEARAALDTLTVALANGAERDQKAARAAEILRVRLLWDEGRSAEARAMLWEIERRFERARRGREHGVQSYLELEEAVALRDAVHEMGGLSPEDGYRFECEWRSLLDPGSGAAAPPARGAAAPAFAGKGVHLVYHFTGDRLLRWTASARGVALDTLRFPARECLAAIREALPLLQTEPAPSGAVMGPRSLDKLRRLSRRLLPAWPDGPPARVYVSPDGPLAALPFEALPVMSGSGEAPLAAHTDVAYAHGWHRGGPVATGTPVIVASPRLSPELRRRYAAVELPVSDGDVAAARRRWPAARVLTGEHATKSEVIESWRGASSIYLAAHHVRDPDAPFLGFVPLAAASGAGPGDDLLEIADLQGMDLTRCRLVVLAACATGAPYRLAVRPGPSLGQAFLDSGAGAVVQSSWDVGDRDTGAFMKRFLEVEGGEPDPVAALGRARRAAMESRDGAAPRVWAAWSIHVGLPRPGAARTGS